MLVPIGPTSLAIADECLSVWIDADKPAQCDAVNVREGFARQRDMCFAARPGTAVLRVKVTDCLEGPRAAIPVPAAALIERLIVAQVTEGKVSRELTGRDNRSWPGATQDLYQTIKAWHRKQAGHLP
jgi:hypothetical protein